jgi:hypothetical protein
MTGIYANGFCDRVGIIAVSSFLGAGILWEIDWIASIAGPIFVGLFVVAAYGHIVDVINADYAKRSKQIAFLFPPSFVGAGSIKLQRALAVFVGGAFVLFGVANLIKTII